MLCFFGGHDCPSATFPEAQMSHIDNRLSAMLATRAAGADPKEFFLDLVDLVAKDASEVLGRELDEIGILMVGTDGKYLRFAAPRKLCDLGTIPTTKRDSIAVAVFMRKTAEANNNVPLARHVAFFESVKVREKAQPIMKMVTVPIIVDNAVVAVAQVSKKGDTLAGAGPDFGPADVRRVKEYFETKAAFILAARPPQF